jgi:SulP family sulfate permease
MRNVTPLGRILPITHWLSHYDRQTLAHDLFGAMIVSFLFIPQSLAYAVQAGLPASAGLYASIAPVIGYALFGTSRSLAVGPFAITSLMTGAILSRFAAHGSADYVALALVLALLTGLILALMGLLRLGFLSNFLSYPVSSAYITASAILIATSQLKLILGIEGHGTTLPEIVPQLIVHARETNAATAGVGGLSIIAIGLARGKFEGFLCKLGLGAQAASMGARAAPLAVAGAAAAAVYFGDLQRAGVRVVGSLSGGIPPFTVPPVGFDIWLKLLPSAALIALVGFMGAVSTAQTFAAKKRETILPDQELLGLGAANILAAFFGGFPVTGAVTRTVVNHSAGVRTPVASVFTAVGIALVSGLLAPLLFYLPQAVLAAIVIVAATSLADLKTLRQTWVYSGADFAAALATLVLTLLYGVEIGIVGGMLISVTLYLYRTSRPHLAVVGLVPHTEHFRSVMRYDVITSPTVLNVRVDESLYFANARYLEERIGTLVAEEANVKHLVLICSAINDIDASALESLEALNERLRDMGVTFHLSEVKGPVMDRLRRSEFLTRLSGRVYLSQFLAIADLDADVVRRGRSQGLPATDAIS